MNFTNTCSAQNSGDTEINNLAQSIFIVLSFCSVISNIVIYSDKILENNEINKKFKSMNNTYSVLKEYFFNNYKFILLLFLLLSRRFISTLTPHKPFT